MTLDWSNWSGNQIYRVNQLVEPQHEDEICAVIRASKKSNKIVRAVGASHSFNDFWTDDTIVSLERMKGIVDADIEKCELTLRSGTRLFEIGSPAWNHGLSMTNMGDIDRQSLAGALSTGTHGTGETLANLSSGITGLKLINGEGESVHLTEETNPDELKAARVSLGSLGIITEVTMKMSPQYYLHEKTWLAEVDACEEKLSELVANNRHFEFFWDPQSDQCSMKTLNKCPDDLQESLPEGERKGRNYEILPSSREHKFNEMEFSLPKEVGWGCFLEVRAAVKKSFPKLRWPIEYRTLKADDAYLSTAFHRETVTISIHEGAKRDYENLFLAIEEIFKSFNGRPHWGKVHTHKSSDFERLYPDWKQFLQIREEFDPSGIFLNNYLRDVFGTY